MFLLAFIFCGCEKQTETEPPTVGDTPGDIGSKYHKTVPVGTVPDEFGIIVGSNLFQGATAYSDKILKVGDPFEKNLIRIYNKQGVELANKVIDLADDQKIACCFLSESGDLICVYGTDIHYGTASYDMQDIVTYVEAYEISGSSLRREHRKTFYGYEADMFEAFYEMEEQIYFFGTVTKEKNGKKTVGDGKTDISAIMMSGAHRITKQKTYGGSDFDSFCGMTFFESGREFFIAVLTQSTDGDFEGLFKEKKLRIATLKLDDCIYLDYVEDDDFDYRSSVKRRVGFLGDDEIYDNDEMFADFADGEITALIDYGDFYLVVSENITGIDQNTPIYISSIWYTTETVYAAYKKDGTLIWKAATDSTNR